MAKIVLGIGTSHSTQCSLTPDWWEEQGKMDPKRTPYEALLSKAPEWMPEQLTPEVWQKKYDEIQQSIAKLQDTIKTAAPDVMVIDGDDQDDIFPKDAMPMLALFWGDEVWDIPGPVENLSPSHRAGRWAIHADEPEAYPVDSGLALHMVKSLVEEDFDIMQLTKQAEGRSLGHAWTFVKRRLMPEKPIPMVPVLINTYFPPNQPSAARCYELGRAIRRAVESWPEDTRVAVVASGGLSHFVVDEELDDRIIKGLRNKDAEDLKSIPKDQLQAGNSEILNWITTAGAVEHLDMELISYTPAYRTRAGTGCGITFAKWN
ncbi:extradiol ring-cleavage dioxygenase [Hoeflea sp.]|uniref:DODA-type extradiol aromatic ring-opening family dioxygenase n=1 Tax=Hoeflea sp. TaxID=1940281 RepID=UPI003B02AFB4